MVNDVHAACAIALEGAANIATATTGTDHHVLFIPKLLWPTARGARPRANKSHRRFNLEGRAGTHAVPL